MAYVLEQSVLEAIKEIFPNDDVPNAISLLENTKLWSEDSGPPPRVHHALIALSNGDIRKLENLLECYAEDWRDALEDAGLADSNWRDILRKRGVDFSKWKSVKT